MEGSRALGIRIDTGNYLTYMNHITFMRIRPGGQTVKPFPEPDPRQRHVGRNHKEPIVKRIFAVLAAVVLISFLPPSAGAQPKTKAPASYAPSDLISITVDRGDYLIAICKRYLDGEKRWPEIARINRMGNAHRVQPGAKLNVPIAYLKGVPVNGRVTFVQGDAKARPGGQGGWVSLKAGDTVSPKSALKTGPESALEITFEDGSSFLLRSNTEMGIVSAQKVLSSRLVRDLYLGAGRVLTNVKEATGEAPRFKIRTPSAIASVRGDRVPRRRGGIAEDLRGGPEERRYG